MTGGHAMKRRTASRSPSSPTLLKVAARGPDDDPSEARTRVTSPLDWTPNTNHSGVYLADAEAGTATPAST